MPYSGSIELISGLKQKNNNSFPLVDAKDIYVYDDVRLDAEIAALHTRIDYSGFRPYGVVLYDANDASSHPAGTLFLIGHDIYEALQTVPANPGDIDWTPEVFSAKWKYLPASPKAVSYGAVQNYLTDSEKSLARRNINAEKETNFFDWQYSADNPNGLLVLRLIKTDTDLFSLTEKGQNANFKYQFGQIANTYTEYGWMGLCNIKLQGSSSLAYPKKNYTIKFLNPANPSQKVSFDLKDAVVPPGAGETQVYPPTDWGSHDKYVLKANYIDASHLRNVVCAKLWGADGEKPHRNRQPYDGAQGAAERRPPAAHRVHRTVPGPGASVQPVRKGEPGILPVLHGRPDRAGRGDMMKEGRHAGRRNVHGDLPAEEACMGFHGRTNAHRALVHRVQRDDGLQRAERIKEKEK